MKRIEDVLIKAEEFRLLSKRQLQQSEEEIEVIVVDVAETEIERPKKNKGDGTIREPLSGKSFSQRSRLSRSRSTTS